MAKRSRRLETNAAGDFYVDSTCIDCGTCRWMAPRVFDQSGDYSRVHSQPTEPEQIRGALRALVACPVASIGTIQKHDVDEVAAEFPVLIADNVYHCGYHHRDSFGAASYLVTRPEGNVMVDSPRFAKPLVRRIEELGGVEMMFLTHRDDVADHQRFADHFGCRRVLHRDDVTRSTRGVESQPEGTDPIELASDLVMIPVPGHTRGSACLLHGEHLFTGDHLAWSMSLDQLYAFSGACWYDWETQIESMQRLVEYKFTSVHPGHSAPCSFDSARMQRELAKCIAWMETRR